MKVIKQEEYYFDCINDRYGDFYVHAKWDGCCDINRYHNGYTYKDKNIPDADVDYIHICNLREFINFLTEIADKAEQIEGFEGYERG